MCELFISHKLKEKNIACLIEEYKNSKEGGGFTYKSAGQRLLYCNRGLSSFFYFAIAGSFDKLIRLRNSLTYSVSILFAEGFSPEL